MNNFFLIILFTSFFISSDKENTVNSKKKVVFTAQIESSEINQLLHRYNYFVTKNESDSVRAISIKIINKCSDNFSKDDLALSEKYYDLAERQFLRFKDYEKLGVLFNYKGNDYFNVGLYSIALKYFKKSEAFYKKSPFPYLGASPSNNLGRIYYSIGDYKNARLKYSESIKYLNQCKGVLTENILENEMISRKMNVSTILIDEKKYRQAANEFSKLIDTPDFEKHISTDLRLMLYENLLIAKSHLSGDPKLKLVEDQILRINVNILSVNEKNIYYESLAYIYAFKLDKTRSYSNIYSALEISEGAKDTFSMIQNYYAMIFLAKKFRDSDTIIKYQQKLIDLKEDDIATVARRNVQEFASLYQLEDLEKEKQQFRDQNVINSANLKVKEAENSRLKIIVLGLVFLALISLFAVRLYLKRYNLLASQKSIIEKKNVELEKISNDLSLSNKTIKKTFSIIAHDLRNPFNALLGYSNLLVANFEKYDDRKKLHYAKMVRNAAETNFNLTQNLLVWSLKQHQGYEVVKTSQNIQQIIEQVWSSLSGIAELKNILIEVDMPDKLALFDLEIVSTILNNLLTNAIKFANADSIIKVDGTFSDEELKLVIYNEGSIVPLEKLNSITTYLKAATTDETYKVGFGLKIAKELALLHNGFIEFYSEKGATEVNLILKNT